MAWHWRCSRKRVMLKINSGIGRLQDNLLATLRLIGVYKYPGPPNTTSVTLETDQNYGLCKTTFRTNLDYVMQAQLNENESCNLLPYLIGMIVLGGQFLWQVLLLRGVQLRKPFQSYNTCLHGQKLERHHSWESALIQSKLDSNLDMQMMRWIGWQSLWMMETGWVVFDTKWLWWFCTPGWSSKGKKETVTVPHSQGRIALMVEVKTHDQLFCAPSGDHDPNNDSFKATELPFRKKKIWKRWSKKGSIGKTWKCDWRKGMRCWRKINLLRA